MKLRIGARPSALAQAQAESVRRALAAQLKCQIELVAISTSGDRTLTPSLAPFGGKGLFIRELEQALAARRIDLAVHSMKDLPAQLDPRFRLVAAPTRENPCDVLITRDGAHLDDLPKGSRTGTSSPRRRCQLLRRRPDLIIAQLRGNIDTRLRKLSDGEYDAIVLALAGLNRLGLARRLALTELHAPHFIPAAGQGALAVEALSGRAIGGSNEIDQTVAALNDPVTAAETSAERSVLAELHASCVSPIGVKASLDEAALRLNAILFSLDGARRLEASLERPLGSDPAAAGVALAREMLAQGAADLMRDG